MNSKSDNQVDRKVSEVYRKSSSESAPDALNRAVLAEAAGVSTSDRMATLFAWCRPLAFAATLLLGVALVYDMQSVLQETGVPFESETDSFDDVAPRLDSDSTQDTSTNAGKPSLSKPAVAPVRASRKTGAPPVSQMAEQMPEQAAEQTGEQTSVRQNFEKRESNAEPQRSRMERSAAAAPAAALRSTEEESLAADTPAEIAAPLCTEQQQGLAKDWWQCVLDLRKNAGEQAAHEELQRLKARYPDFEEPE